jgi:hypothetical protein
MHFAWSEWLDPEGRPLILPECLQSLLIAARFA